MDSFVTYLILFIIGCFVLMCVIGYRQHKYGTGHKVKMQLKDNDTGRVTRTGIGHSYGNAVVDLCSKLYSGAPMTKISGIQDRIDSMNQVINEYQGRMKEADLQTCISYRNRLTSRINDLKREEENRKRQAEAERQKKQQEQKEIARKQAAERRQREKEKEQARIEKEKTMSEQKRFIAAQRRLMTDSLRYDVMHRDGFRCVLCGASPKTDPNIVLHVDHILPLSKGGKTEMSNLRTLCERCNLGKRDKIEAGTTVTPEQFEAIVSKNDVPAKKTSETKEKQVSQSKGIEDPVLNELKSNGIKYVDNRKLGGALWAIGGHELDTVMTEMKKRGIAFVYSEKGGKATKGKAGWWYKAE